MLPVPGLAGLPWAVFRHAQVCAACVIRGPNPGALVVAVLDRIASHVVRHRSNSLRRRRSRGARGASARVRGRATAPIDARAHTPARGMQAAEACERGRGLGRGRSGNNARGAAAGGPQGTRAGPPFRMGGMRERVHVSPTPGAWVNCCCNSTVGTYFTSAQYIAWFPRVKKYISLYPRAGGDDEKTINKCALASARVGARTRLGERCGREAALAWYSARDTPCVFGFARV